MILNNRSTDGDEPTTNRRSLLRSLGTAGIVLGTGTAGIGAFSGTALAGDWDLTYEDERSTENAADTPHERRWWDGIQISAGSAVQYEDPTDRDGPCIEDDVDGFRFRVDLDAVCHVRDWDDDDDEVNVDERREEIKTAYIKVQGSDPSMCIGSGKAPPAVGGWTNYTSSGAGIDDATVVSYVMDIVPVPYGGAFANAYEIASNLSDNANSDKSDVNQWKHDWSFSSAERVNTYARFVAEVPDGANYDIDIEVKVGTGMGDNYMGNVHNYTLDVNDWGVYSK
jgi:hypothetical protein